jgi:hypothetical protein
MATILRANTELVAVAFLASLPGVPTGAVATTLPADGSSWAAEGFVQVTTIGGSSSAYVPLRVPAVQVDVWANTPTSQKPPWGKANNLAEAISAGVYSLDATHVELTLPGDYPGAMVHAAFFASEWRRVPDDAANYARFTADMIISWTEIA